MRCIKILFQKEKILFDKLNHNGKRLITTITLYNIVQPILDIFINVFLWRQTQNIILVALFNLLLYFFIPLGFYFNGFLLKFFSASKLYFLSLFLKGGTISLLIFLSKVGYLTIPAFGLIYGITNGMYWANRNLLTLKVTETNNRIYFSSLESVSQNITSIIIPVFIGWFIVAGNSIHLYSPIQGYQIIMILILPIIAVTGTVAATIQIIIKPPKHLWLQSVTANWQKFRAFEFIFGLLGINFVQTLIVITLVGNEEKLGLIQSLSTIGAVLIIYTVVKALDVKHRVRFLEISILISIIGAGLFSAFYSATGVFILFACQTLASPFNWIATSSINYDLIDKETNEEKHYAYVCDQEIYLNGGRVFAILLFILLAQFVSNQAAFRLTPLIFYLCQLLLLLIARSI